MQTCVQCILIAYFLFSSTDDLFTLSLSSIERVLAGQVQVEECDVLHLPVSTAPCFSSPAPSSAHVSWRQLLALAGIPPFSASSTGMPGDDLPPAPTSTEHAMSQCTRYLQRLIKIPEQQQAEARKHQAETRACFWYMDLHLHQQRMCIVSQNRANLRIERTQSTCLSKLGDQMAMLNRYTQLLITELGINSLHENLVEGEKGEDSTTESPGPPQDGEDSKP